MRETVLTTVAMFATLILGAILVIILLCATEAKAMEVDMAVIAQIESSNRPSAYNSKTKATGKYQITPICLADYNLFAKSTPMVLEDMFVPKKAHSVAVWYLQKRIPQLISHFRHKDTLENRLIAYNCGISCVGNPLPSETINYIKKYRRLTK